MRSGQNKRGQFLPEAPAGGEDKVKVKMEPERTTLESSSAGTGVEVPNQLCLSCREMQPRTVGSCTHTAVEAQNRRIASSFFEPFLMKHPIKHQNSPSLAKLSSGRWTGYKKRWTWIGGHKQFDPGGSVRRGSYFSCRAAHITARQPWL